MVNGDQLRVETVDLRELLDRPRLSAVQWQVFLLCALCLVVDGFDIQSIGFVAPAIADEWGVKPMALGIAFASGLFGMMVGSAVFSLLADRFGRRPMLVIATFLVGVAMLVTSQVRNIDELMIMRFVTGLGLGSLVPNALALTSEYSPTRSRTAIVIVMGTGLTLGAAISGWLTAMIIPIWGWRGVFVLGGSAPLVLSVVMMFGLPESLRLLVLRKAAPQRINRLVRRLHADFKPNVTHEVVVAEQADPRISVVQLFREGRARTTTILWVVAFMALLDLYFLSNWLPTVIRGSGYSLHAAVVASTMLQVGGVIGSLSMALMVGRVALRRILAAAFGVACVSIFVIGQVAPIYQVLLAVVFIAGICTVGCQPGLNALSAGYYPTVIRSTGVGWMLAVGRLGSICGPLAGGAILQGQLGTKVLFLLAAIPALIAACGLWLIGRVERSGQSASEGKAADHARVAASSPGP